MKKLIVSVAAVLASAGMAMAVGFALPPVTDVLPGATVVIPVNAVGAGAVQGVNLNLQVGAPGEIVGINLLSGIFAGNATVPYYDIYPTGTVPAPQYAVASVTTVSGLVPTPGKIADVTIKIPLDAPLGYLGFLRTEIPDFGLVSDFTVLAADAQGMGQIRVIPEPVTALLLLGALPFLRRRHA